MTYTVRFAHLERAPAWKEGDVLRRGAVIGRMGSTGQSTAAHLHIDVVEGRAWVPFKLSQIGSLWLPSEKQLNYFIDEELFGVAPLVMTPYMDPAYRKEFGKDHPAIDVVPEDRKKTRKHFDIHWNRSMKGEVSLVVYQPESYGHCVYVAFEA